MLSILKRRAEFLAAASSGRKCATKGLVLQARAHESGQESGGLRYGLTASKRVGNAVMRNRAKRRLRALAREVLPAMAGESCDYVLIARPETVSRDFAALRGDLLYALRRLNAAKAASPKASSKE